MEPLNPCSPPDLRYLRYLTDDFGVLQHTERGKPRLEFGYALDDVARALIVVIETHLRFGEEQNIKPTLLELADRYLRFIAFCQEEDGRFHNFVSHRRDFLDDTGSLDSFGRTVWALAVTASAGKESAPLRELGARARDLLSLAIPHVHELPHLRSKAFSLLGIAAVSKVDEALHVLEHLRHLLVDLLHAYADAATDEWPWFEDTLRYSNAALVYALLVAADVPALRAADAALADKAQGVGVRALDFLLRELSEQGVPAPVGNRGWYPRGGKRALYDQQCVDAAAMVVACVQAWAVTGDARYRDAAQNWWRWFFGNNTRNLALYRPEDGSLYDGLTAEGLNEDRGAESVIAFLLAHLKLAETCPEFKKASS